MGLFNNRIKKANEELKLLTETTSEDIKSLTATVQSLKLQTALQNSVKQINNSLALYPTWDITEQGARYVSTDDIYSIIRLLSTTAALVPLYAYLQKPDAKSYFNKLTNKQKGFNNPLSYKTLQLKALEDLPDTDPVAQLLESPHEGMSKYEFFEAAYSFLFTFGEVFILKKRPDLGPNQGKPVTLLFMYPQYVSIKISLTMPRRILAYDYRVNGVLIEENILPEDVIHIKYFNPEINLTGSELRGLSPLKVLKKRLTRLDSNMDVSVAQLQHGGVPGIVYEKGELNQTSIEITGSRKDNFYRYLNSSNSAGAPYFASGEMGYIQTGMNLADLKVADLAGIDFKKLCNAFGVSDVLFNSSDTNSENNVLIQTKRLYTNTVLPNVYRVRDALVKGLLPDFKDGVLLQEEDSVVRIKGDGIQRYIDADISDITELHEDLAKRSVWMASAWWLTPNEKREMMNYDRFDDPMFDEPLLPVGMQSLEDFKTIPPLPDVTGTGN